MEDAHGLNYRLVIFPILRWNQEDSLRHVGRHFDTKGKLEIQKWISLFTYGSKVCMYK